MERRAVTIPACEEHAGMDRLVVTLPWACIHCGAPRGEPYAALSHDGSRALAVHAWCNPCGHVEPYSEIRAWLVRRVQPKTPTAPAITDADVPY